MLRCYKWFSRRCIKEKIFNLLWGKDLNYRTHSYRHAEIILNSKYAIRREIEEILKKLEVEHGERKTSKSKVLPHDMIRKAFIEAGWSSDRLVGRSKNG